jgi:hypothetical protein
MLNENLTICVKATKITYEKEFIVAWWEQKPTAMFKSSEVIGCWLEGVCFDGKVY